MAGCFDIGAIGLQRPRIFFIFNIRQHNLSHNLGMYGRVFYRIMASTRQSKLRDIQSAEAIYTLASGEGSALPLAKQ